VFFRKWFHAVPKATPASGGAIEVSAADVASLVTAGTTLANCLSSGYGLSMGSSRRLAVNPPTVSSFYENHQMPRGRRRKALVTASGRYTGPTIEVPGAPEVVLPD
jgi:hypothetical protein